VEANRVVFWLQLAANVGLLTGLVLVGIQISQSNAIARASTGSVYFQQYQDFLVAGIGENPAAVRAKAVFEPENLTPENIEVLISETYWRISMIEHNTAMEEYGILDDSWRAEIPEHAFFIARTPVAREILSAHCAAGQWAVSELCKMVEEQPKNEGRSHVEKYLRAAKSYATSED
jgi:hypothetical protein